MTEPARAATTFERATGAGQPAPISMKAFQLGPDDISRLIEIYASNPLFQPTGALVIADNPYRRPVAVRPGERFDFSRPLSKGELLGSSALAAHRLLFNIYESDLLFLPDEGFAAKRDDFVAFYSDENKLLGEMIRPTLEAHVFGFLPEEVGVSGGWTVESLKAYLDSLVAEHEQSELSVVTAILSCAEPKKAAAALLIQVASDFLTEASASARNVLGKYGQVQSELFKILIDDYGYGVHQAKHSTLFENTLLSCGLNPQAHAYWQFYLGSSLALANYYHYVSRNHSRFFRYVGAFAFAEAMFSHTCRQIARLLRTVYGAGADTYYFDEHYHIDAHHGRMAFDGLVAPAVARYGNAVIEEILRGMEEVRLLTALADEDFIAQINWADRAESGDNTAQQVYQGVLDGKIDCLKTTYTAQQAEHSVMHVADEDLLCVVEAGSMQWTAGYDQAFNISAGQGLVIPRHRQHAATALSEDCVYSIYNLGDYRACLS